jgi:hypothetical protein
MTFTWEGAWEFDPGFPGRYDEDDARTIWEMRRERLGQRERPKVVRCERQVPTQSLRLSSLFGRATHKA